MRFSTTAALALCGALALGGPALAQSINAPAGMDAATAPGGTEGIAGPRNETRAIRDGDAIPAAPGAGIPAPGIDPASPAAPGAVPPGAPPRP